MSGAPDLRTFLADAEGAGLVHRVYRKDFRRARPRGHGRVWLEDFLR